MTKNTKIKRLDKSKMRLTSFTKILRNGSTEKVAMVTIPFENILRIYAECMNMPELKIGLQNQV